MRAQRTWLALTPALSPRKGIHQRPRREKLLTSELYPTLEKILPLPEGEGRGEGEREFQAHISRLEPVSGVRDQPDISDKFKP